MTERLYRSPVDRVIAGVAGGLAVWLDIDPSLVRIAWVLLAIFSGGIFVLVYIVMMIVVPLPPDGYVPRQRTAPAGVPPAGWQPTGTAYGSPDAQAGWNAAPGAAPGGYPGQPPGPAWGTGQPGPQPAWTPPAAGNVGIVVGAILIILGAWFLVDQFVHINWSLVWPVLVIGAGLLLIVAALRRRA